MKTEAESEADLLTTEQFARAMCASQRRVRRWIARGFIRRNEYIKPIWQILIRREALQRLTALEEAKETPPRLRRRPRMDAKRQAAYDLARLQKTLAKAGRKRTKRSKNDRANNR